MTHGNKVFMETLKAWLPFAVIIVVMSGLVYVAVQQNYRQSANDPQIQIVEDIANAIEAGTPAASIAPPTGTTDIAKSLSPFVLIYDDTGKLLGSSAVLGGKNPSFPSSIFDQVKQHGQENLTWQPQSGVRIAAVVARYSGAESGYVVAGRSLTEVEKREKQLMVMTSLSALFALILTFLVCWLFEKMKHKQMTITETTVEVSEDKMVS